VNNKKWNKRKIIDSLMTSMTYIVSFVGVFTFGAIIYYVVQTGGSLISWELVTGDSADINTNVFTEEVAGNYVVSSDFADNVFYSEAWGLGFVDGKDKEGHDIVTIEYVHEDSPFVDSIDKDFVGEGINYIEVTEGTTVKKIMHSAGIALDRFGAEALTDSIDSAESIKYMTIQKTGGGIRGSLITTLYLIFMTLALALPLGVFTAIYLNEYAPKSSVTNILRTMIDMLTGVPSIIYGLMGAAVFIPLMNKLFNTSGGSLLSGALTMAVILLPVIIKSTEEALKVIPKDIRSASLALGASKTQTTFKVVLPNTITGILTGILLGIGRIIGESAALIYAIGAAIKDDVNVKERSTTLAVHIWTVMGGEVPNFELASAIAIIILVVVLVLTLSIKLFANRLNRRWQ
jgi:phosphate transport system permease protein